LWNPPVRVAEEYAMLDQMTNGRLVAGFAMGGGQELFNYNVPPPIAREQYWEAIDLIVRAWTEDGPFSHDGKHYPSRYVNCWPRPYQRPHPPIWIPGALSAETMAEVARRGYTYFLSTRAHLSITKQAADRFARQIEAQGGSFDPFRMGATTTPTGVSLPSGHRSARSPKNRGSGASTGSAPQKLPPPHHLHLLPARLHQSTIAPFLPSSLSASPYSCFWPCSLSWLATIYFYFAS
jgi:hypothetical protein